jgi:hypothetical protein
MSTMTIIGLVLWGIALLFGSVTFNEVAVKNPLLRVVAIVIAIPFIGVVFSIIGLLGLVLLAPVLHFSGWEWFITTNF